MRNKDPNSLKTNKYVKVKESVLEERKKSKRKRDEIFMFYCFTKDFQYPISDLLASGVM